ncbi:rhodanese-like domain-containing protein [Streptacidiphilus monticola]|uniref:Rhodanese-like domain-containing protein n=1 Tax=Streptacidiphilus monticola TaxID=2161674 RepID=A0ABW1G748_9ACTN
MSAVDTALARARAGLRRLTPEQAARAAAEGALLVDTRYAALRERDGEVPGAAIVERNELEWRLDPTSEYRLAGVEAERQVILFCNEGYASSFAAHALRSLGITTATDVIGGFQAWRHAGLPTTPPGTASALTPHVQSHPR